MIWARLINGISEHFSRRRAEWALAILQVGLGVIELAAILRSNVLLSTSFFGVGCCTVGVFRLVALMINGTFAKTWYGRWSHHVRGSLAIASCFFWTTVVIDACNSGMPSFAVFTYLGLLFLEISNVKDAWQDAGEADRDVVNASI